MMAASTAVIRRPAATPAPLPLAFHRVRLDDLPRVRGAFAEGYKNSPGLSRMPWRFYKQHIVPQLHAVLVHPTTELMGAYSHDELYEHSGQLCGWLAYSRGRRVDTVHWVSVPYWFPMPSTACIGCVPAIRGPQHHDDRCPLAPARRTPIRHRGIMTGLFDAASLSERLAYTHKGALHEHRNDGVTMDERLLPWFRARGHQGLAFVRWEEWSR